MQNFDYGFLVDGNKGLFFAKDNHLYFPNRNSNLKEGIITNIRIVKDFLDDRGYAFIDAEMLETEPFTNEDLTDFADEFSGVRRVYLGKSEVILCLKAGFDFNLFTSRNDNFTSVSAYFKYDGKIRVLFDGINERAFHREPCRTFLHKAKSLGVDFLKQYSRTHFVDSDLTMKLGLLKFVKENNTFLNQVTFGYNADFGIYKAETRFSYSHETSVSYCVYNGKALLRISNIDSLGDIPFKEITLKTIRQWANDMHICTSTSALKTCTISSALCSKVFRLGTSAYLVYAFNVIQADVDSLSNAKLQELVEQTSETYMAALRKCAKNLTAKNIGDLTLQSWYVKTN